MKIIIILIMSLLGVVPLSAQTTKEKQKKTKSEIVKKQNMEKQKVISDKRKIKPQTTHIKIQSKETKIKGPIVKTRKETTTNIKLKK